MLSQLPNIFDLHNVDLQMYHYALSDGLVAQVSPSWQIIFLVKFEWFFYYNRWNVVRNTRVTWSDNQNVSCLCEQAVKKRQCQQVFWFKPFGVLTDASNKRQRMLQTDIQERLCWWRAGCAELAHLMECLSCACCWVRICWTNTCICLVSAGLGSLRNQSSSRESAAEHRAPEASQNFGCALTDICQARDETVESKHPCFSAASCIALCRWMHFFAVSHQRYDLACATAFACLQPVTSVALSYNNIINNNNNKNKYIY